MWWDMPKTIRKAVILAGGRGSRLHPVTLELPKPLITIRKRPLINYNLHLFARHGVTDMVVIIRPEDRSDYERWAREHGSEFTDLGMSIQFVEEREPMGTLGYFFFNLREWAGDEDVFVSNGDEIKKIDLEAMVDLHERMHAAATLALVREKERKDCGFVLISENRVMEFLEKKDSVESDLMSAGLYIISPNALRQAASAMPAGRRFLMFETDLFPALTQMGELAGFIDAKGTVFDCGTFDRWERAIREV